MKFVDVRDYAGSKCILPAGGLVRHLLIFLTIILSPAPLIAGDVSGKVISVLDGDTIKVLHNNQPERIRLQGIDCPEKGQAFGQRAKQVTSEWVFGKEVTLHIYGKDKRGRTIADVVLSDGTNLSHLLVRDGWCWWYKRYAPNNVILEELERRARASRIGLWAETDPIPPWLYRKLHSGPCPRTKLQREKKTRGGLLRYVFCGSKD